MLIDENESLSNYKIGDIIDVYSREEMLSANINEETKEWVRKNGDIFVGYCLDNWDGNDEDRMDFMGLYKEDIEIL